MFDCGEWGVMRQSLPYIKSSHDAPAGGALESLFFLLSAPVVVPLISTHSPHSPLPYIVHHDAHTYPAHKSVDLLASAEQDTHPPQDDTKPRERDTKPKPKTKKKKNREEKRGPSTVC